MVVARHGRRGFGERNVTQVVEETGRNQANVSKHLKMLAEAGLVARRKEGLPVFYEYKLDDPLVVRLCKPVCETIVEEEEMARRKKPLDAWGGKNKPGPPQRGGHTPCMFIPPHRHHAQETRP